MHRRVLFLVIGYCLMSGGFLSGQTSKIAHDSIKLLDEKNKPERIHAHAFSPDGRLLALRVSDFVLRVIDLENRKLKASYADMDIGAIAFSSDSKHLVGIGEFSDVVRIDVENGDTEKIRETPWKLDYSDPAPTKVDIEISKSDGKLIVSSIGETLKSTDVELGDELIAIKNKIKPGRGKNKKGWSTLLGRGSEGFPIHLKGRANTWFQLRFRREGRAEPIEIELQRIATDEQEALPKSEGSIALGRIGRSFVFYSGDSAAECMALTLRDTMQKGQGTIAPNGKYFGWVAVLQDGWDVCAEVYSLESGRVVASNVVKSRRIQRVRFSADSKHLLVGTPSSVEVLDIASGSWKGAVKLPEGPEIDRVVKRSVPLGLGGLPGMRSSYKETVKSKADPLSDFDFSPASILAVGSAAGDLTLVYKKRGETQFLKLDDRMLNSRAEFVRFNPTGDRLVAYAKGNLHIVNIDDEFRNSHLK